MSKKTVLVTGGAGFIGSHIADELIKKGHKVVIFDDLSGGFLENVNPKAVFIKGSVCDVGLVNKIFGQYKFDYVFHLAAYAAEGLSHFIKKFNYENNLVGSVNLTNASVNFGVKCFVFTSSIAVYGSGQTPMSEDMVPEPEDSYGISKYAVELELKASHKMFGLDYVIFRPHNVYGERQNIGDKYRNVIGIFMNQIMRKDALSIFGDGTQERAFTYIKDVAPVIAGSAFDRKVYNQVFNVGADKAYTIKELIEVVCKSMSVKAKIKHFPERKEAKVAFAEHLKIRKFFGEREETTLKEGVKKMAEWALKVGPRSSSEFKNIEIVKNLPKAWK